METQGGDNQETWLSVEREMEAFGWSWEPRHKAGSKYDVPQFRPNVTSQTKTVCHTVTTSRFLIHALFFKRIDHIRSDIKHFNYSMALQNM